MTVLEWEPAVCFGKPEKLSFDVQTSNNESFSVLKNFNDIN